MAKPIPNSLSMSQVRSDLNGTGAINFNLSQARNLAAQQTNLSAIRGSDLSYGRNFPAVANGLYTITMERFKTIFDAGCNVYGFIKFFPDGTGKYTTEATRQNTADEPAERIERTFIWLPDGSNAANHYARVQDMVEIERTLEGTGLRSTLVTGVTANADAQLSSTADFEVRASASTGICSIQLIFEATVILKYSNDGGVTKEEYFRRPLRFTLRAERDTLN
jgi:hypothetical protein